MNDPFLSSGGGAGAQREVQRLIKENKELREENARLRAQLATATATAHSAPSAGEGKRRKGAATESASTPETKAGDAESVASAKETRANRAEGTASTQKLQREVEAHQRAREAAENAVGVVRGELKTVKALFEAFVNDTCEREAAYKLVYNRMSEELEEKTALTDSLQRQVQELREQLARPAPASSSSFAAPSRTALKQEEQDIKLEHVAGVLEALQETVGNLQGLLGLDSEQVSVSGRSRRGAAKAATKTSRVAADLTASAQREATTVLSPSAMQAEGSTSFMPPPPRTATGEPPAPVLHIAKGAGALRDTSTDEADEMMDGDCSGARKRPRGSSNTSATQLQSEGVAVPPRRRGRPLKSDSSRSIGSPTGSSMFERFAAQSGATASGAPSSSAATGEKGTTGSNGPSTTAAAATLSQVRFGDDPIADFLRLADHTQLTHMDRLRQELLKYFDYQVGRLVRAVLQHLRSKASTNASPAVLWKLLERVVAVDPVVYPALCEALTRELARQVGPESSSDLSSLEDVRVLATVLRLALVQHGKRTGQPQSHLLSQACVELSVGALQLWRGGRSPTSVEVAVADGVAEAGTSSESERGRLEGWRTAVFHLCGLPESVQQLLQYQNAEEAAAQLVLPHSLVMYTIQAIMAQCFIGSGEAGEDDRCVQSWYTLCEAVGWSPRQLPLEAIAEVAAQRAASSASYDAASRAETVLALRFLVLYKGFGYLQTLTDALQQARGATPSGSIGTASTATNSGASSADVDALFAELFSFAVIDLRLEDTRDAQWHRAMAFFNDYLQSASEEDNCSVAEMLSATTESHVLVLRAIVQLCHGDLHHEGFDENAAASLAQALRWLKMQQVGLQMVEKARSGQGVPYHPLRDTALGRSLLRLL